MLNFLILRIFLALLELVLFILNSLKIIKVTLVVCELLVEEINDLFSCRIQEVTSVRHDNYGDIETLDIVLKPDKGVQIEMISRLIEK